MRELEIYYTSDVHGYVFPTNYFDTSVVPMGLLALQSVMNKGENTLVIDGGDMIQGSPLTAYMDEQGIDFTLMGNLLHQIGYDYITLGNHDFNYGQGPLMKYIQGFLGTTLSANIHIENQENYIVPTTIKVMPNGLKVGLIGLSTDHIKIWEKPENLEGITITSPIEAAKSYIYELKEQVDVVIGIYHGGFEADLVTGDILTDSTENVAYALCQQLPFDLLLTGHQHETIYNKVIHGTHVVQPGFNGIQVAKILIQVSDQGLLNINSDMISPLVPDIEKLKESLPIVEDFIPIEDEVNAWLDVPIARLPKDLNPGDHLEMASEGHPLVDLMQQIQLAFMPADISCTSLPNEMNGLPRIIARRHVMTTYKYPNTLVIKDIDGATLKEALERSASYFDTLDGQLIISDRFLRPKKEHYNYDYLSGISYTYDIKREVGDRVTQMLYQNQPITMDQKFTIVMNDYRATGTGGYPFYGTAKNIQVDETSTWDVIIDYLKKHEEVVIEPSSHMTIMY